METDLVWQLKHRKTWIFGRVNMTVTVFRCTSFFIHQGREEGCFPDFLIAQIRILEFVHHQELFPRSLNAADINRNPLFILIVKKVNLNIPERLKAVHLNVGKSSVEIDLVDNV